MRCFVENSLSSPNLRVRVDGRMRVDCLRSSLGSARIVHSSTWLAISMGCQASAEFDRVDQRMTPICDKALIRHCPLSYSSLGVRAIGRARDLQNFSTLASNSRDA